MSALDIRVLLGNNYRKSLIYPEIPGLEVEEESRVPGNKLTAPVVNIGICRLISRQSVDFPQLLPAKYGVLTVQPAPSSHDFFLGGEVRSYLDCFEAPWIS